MNYEVPGSINNGQRGRLRAGEWQCASRIEKENKDRPKVEVHSAIYKEHTMKRTVERTIFDLPE